MYLFNLRPGVLIKTLSHIWGKLNLPTLLFKGGLLTLINMDSLIYLDKWCPSLPIICKLLWLVGWPVWLLWWWMAERGFWCTSLYLSPKVLEVSLIYSSSQPRSPHWYQYMAPLWLTKGSLSWGRPGFWWCYHLWSGLEYHIYHRSCWYFHKDLVYRVWQCGP